jgi:uncharacterized protein (UPF0261 family)
MSSIFSGGAKQHSINFRLRRRYNSLKFFAGGAGGQAVEAEFQAAAKAASAASGGTLTVTVKLFVSIPSRSRLQRR